MFTVGKKPVLIDLNKNLTNFHARFQLKLKDINSICMVAVATQDDIDGNNIRFERFTGQIQREIKINNNKYEDYFLVIKSPNGDQECVLNTNVHELKTPKQRDTTPIAETMNINQELPHEFESHDEKKSFWKSSKFLWIVVGILGAVFVYFMFFYKKKKKEYVFNFNNEDKSSDPVKELMHTPRISQDEKILLPTPVVAPPSPVRAPPPPPPVVAPPSPVRAPPPPPPVVAPPSPVRTPPPPPPVVAPPSPVRAPPPPPPPPVVAPPSPVRAPPPHPPVAPPAIPTQRTISPEPQGTNTALFQKLNQLNFE